MGVSLKIWQLFPFYTALGAVWQAEFTLKQTGVLAKNREDGG
jgi:hypothetical protein